MMERGATCLFWRGTQNAPLLLVRSESQGESSHVMEARLIILLPPPPLPPILSPHHLAPGVVQILKMAARNSTPQFIMILYISRTAYSVFTKSMHKFFTKGSRFRKNRSEFFRGVTQIYVSSDDAVSSLEG